MYYNVLYQYNGRLNRKKIKHIDDVSSLMLKIGLPVGVVSELSEWLVHAQYGSRIDLNNYGVSIDKVYRLEEIKNKEKKEFILTNDEIYAWAYNHNLRTNKLLAYCKGPWIMEVYRYSGGDIRFVFKVRDDKNKYNEAFTVENGEIKPLDAGGTVLLDKMPIKLKDKIKSVNNKINKRG